MLNGPVPIQNQSLDEPGKAWRSALLEYFQIASSFEAQRDYTRRVPTVHVPTEVLEMFYDLGFDDESPILSSEQRPLTVAEAELIAQYRSTLNRAWDFLNEPIPTEDCQTRPEWQSLRVIAKQIVQQLVD